MCKNARDIFIILSSSGLVVLGEWVGEGGDC